MDCEQSGWVSGWRRTCAVGGMVLCLGGCEDGVGFDFLKAKPKADEAQTSIQNAAHLIEQDVEAPEIFQATDTGLWDGRPSLGGVWVAHPDVNEPERVIIRNTENSNFVIGALFRRERDNPGPVLQVSSDAAEALGMLAGAPTLVNVTALRREAVPDPSVVPAPSAAALDIPASDTLDAPDEIAATPLDPISEDAAAAIAEAEIVKSAEGATEVAAVATPAPPKKRSKPVSNLEKPFIQIGIFSIEQNARNTATAMRQAGIVPTVKEQSSQGKKFWRVIVGPASSTSERKVLMNKIKNKGFQDAYPVTN